MSTIYYKTEKLSETGNKIQGLIERGKIGIEQAEKLCAELNANKKYLQNNRFIFGTGLTAFHFEEQPDLKHWKKVKNWEGFYEPRLTSKQGKELSEKIFKLERVEKSELSDAIGFNDFFRTPGFINGKLFFGFAIDSDWKHSMPQDCIEITGSEYESL